MSERYYVDVAEPPATNTLLILSLEEARHLVRVMRRKAGDRITLFNGRGLEFESEIIATKRDRVEVRILGILSEEGPVAVPLTLAVALPKGDRQKWMVEKLTELSVSRIIPLSTRYSQYGADEAVLVRLRRQAVEAAKQCGRRRLPEMAAEQTFESLLRLTGHEAGHGEEMAPLRLFAHPVRDGDVGQRFLKHYLKHCLDPDFFVRTTPAQRKVVV
ncbi:MAG TPA: hypothetical protein DEB39_05350, partial [Planctomycetaceae bacterium]|nr:hypothetical protein [Planctomycetaceae bacterium]